MKSLFTMSGPDVMVITMKPKWKWFHPPLWKIFEWAYEVDKVTHYKNCCPVSMNGQSMAPRHITFSGRYAPVEPNILKENLGNLQKLYNKYLEE